MNNSSGLFLVVLGILLALVAGGFGIGNAFVAWHIYQDMQVLRLADDASTPETKAKYLGQFIDKMKSENLPEYANFVWNTERSKVANQLDIAVSLKGRCEQLVGVDPASLGYATGMQQISGQEFDHMIDNLGQIYKAALWKSRGVVVCYGWLVFLVLAFVSIVLASVSMAVGAFVIDRH